MADNTFTKYFGPNAQLIRLARPSGASPFIVADAPTESKYDESSGSWQSVPVGESKYWVYNPKTNSFDAYNNMWGRSSGGTMGWGGLDPSAEGYKPPITYKSLGQSISAADLGLTKDPAMAIAGLASLAGKNADPWSQYALTHNDYGGGVGSESSMLAGFTDLRRALPDIQSYESKDPWDTFMDKYAPLVPLAVAAAAAAGGAGALGETAGTPEISALGTPGTPGVSTVGSTTLPEAITGTELSSGQLAGIPSYTPLGASSAVPGMSMAGTTAGGDLIGYGASGEILTGGASGLAGLIPDVSSVSGSSLGSLLSSAKNASSISDIAKALGNNAGSVGALIGALTAKKPQTVSGMSSRPAWMNQGLPTIAPQTYVSNKIQGDPYRYGMGPQQALYTNQAGQVYQPQNFGDVGGQQFGLPIAKAHGGSIPGEGGLSRAFNYVSGGGSGQADDVDAKLSSGEYVMDADIVSALGDGNNDAGAKILDEFRESIRKHKRSASSKSIPPKAKSVQQYMKGAK